MSSKKPRLIGTLLHDLLDGMPYRQQLCRYKVMEGCRLAFPYLEGQMERFDIKDGILYIKLGSRVLAHELRLNKNKFILGVQKACKSLDEHFCLEDIVTDVVFL